MHSSKDTNTSFSSVSSVHKIAGNSSLKKKKGCKKKEVVAKVKLRDVKHKNSINSRMTKINLVDKQHANEKENIGKTFHEMQ